MKRALRAGGLPEQVAAAFREADQRWDLEPAERRWWDTHDVYLEWLTEHDGEHPTAKDASAAGLHRWACGQKDQNLSREQRTALRRLPGWTRTEGDARWSAARATIRALLERGVTLADTDIEPRLLVGATSSRTVGLPEAAAARRLLLTVLTFAVQTGRLPEHREPGARWEVHIRDQVHELLPAHVFEQPRLTVQTHLARRAALLNLRDDGHAHDEDALRAENLWYRRNRRLAEQGLLSNADTEAMLSA